MRNLIFFKKLSKHDEINIRLISRKELENINVDDEEDEPKTVLQMCNEVLETSKHGVLVVWNDE